MKYIIALLTTLALIISCNTGKKTSLLSKPDDMIADEYIINIDKDTTLVTKNGALLKIPKGSLAIDNGNTVTLEIKEAYSIQQMIQAGLTTQSNGNPLSSGGMIYINAKAGQKVTIKQAIKVAIPADYLNPGMQLFKGEKDDSGTINWNNPAPLPGNEQLNTIERGGQLFETKCASCHSIGKDGIGPNLANILKRPHIDDEGGYPSFHFISKTMSEGYFEADTSKYYHYGSGASAYYCNLRQMFGASATLFPDLTYDDVLPVYSYIQNESNKRNLPMPSHAYLDSCIDSCRVYKEKVDALQYRKQIAESIKGELIEKNGPLVDIKPDPAMSPGNAEDSTAIPPVDFDRKISPKNYDAVYYQFTIESFGWFNIDILLKDVNGVEESELFVRIIGEYREKIKVFLIIPSEKVYGEGGPTGRNSDEFSFFYKNGKLPLPQNAKAYIMAVTETESSIAFALKEFTTGRQQQFDISLKESTKKEFETAIQSISLDRLHIKVADSKNAEAIRRTDVDIKNIDEELKKSEKLKPKGCECDCVYQPLDSVLSDTPKIKKEFAQ